MESISYVNPSPTRPLSRRIVDSRAQRSAQNRRLFPFLVFFFKGGWDECMGRLVSNGNQPD